MPFLQEWTSTPHVSGGSERSPSYRLPALSAGAGDEIREWY